MLPFLNVVLIIAISFEFGIAASMAVGISFEMGRLYMQKGGLREAINSDDFIIIDLKRCRVTTMETESMPERITVFRDGTTYDFVRDGELLINVIDRGAEA